VKRALLVIAAALAVAVVARADAVVRPHVDVPRENDARARRPPTKPGWATDDEAHVRALFEAIQRDAPEHARDFFFPRDPFLVLKGIADPGHYWDILFRHYERDIHALHASTPGIDHATYARFEMSRRATWQAPRTEANALPYWAVRHSRIHFDVGGHDQTIELHVVINWGPRWFVTHLAAP